MKEKFPYTEPLILLIEMTLDEVLQDSNIEPIGGGDNPPIEW